MPSPITITGLPQLSQSAGFAILLSEEFLLELQQNNEYPIRSDSDHSKLLFKIFLTYLSSGISEATGEIYLTREQEITARFLKLVDEAGTMQKRINEYARLLQVSPNNLNRIIKKHTGFSPIGYVHQRFVLLAKKLALETPLSMKEIAYKLGFEDAAHFSKFFKINAGINFSAYKRASLEGQNINSRRPVHRS